MNSMDQYTCSVSPAQPDAGKVKQKVIVSLSLEAAAYIGNYKTAFLDSVYNLLLAESALDLIHHGSEQIAERTAVLCLDKGINRHARD